MSDTLQELLQQASQIKGAQVESDRRVFKSWPTYLQHTLFHPKAVTLWREPDVSMSDRLEELKRMKADGNRCFKDGRLEDAMEMYERAAGLLTFVVSANPDWRKGGIKDEEVTVVSLASTADLSDEDAARVVEAKVTSYQNIAVVAVKLKRWSVAVSAASDAIEASEARSAKAHWLRARARLLCPSSGGVETEAAVKDLRTALSLSSDARQADMLAYERVDRDTVASVLAKTMAQMKRQAMVDSKTFGGMFEKENRTPLYSSDEEDGEGEGGDGGDRGTKTAKTAKGSVGGGGAGAGAGSAGPSFGNGGVPSQDWFEMERMKALVTRLREEGRSEDAKELESAIHRMEAQKKAAGGSSKSEFLAKLDFRNPTREMREHALKMGIDLTDESIVRELERLRNSGELPGMGMAPSSKAGQDTDGASSQSSSWLPFSLEPWMIGFLFGSGLLAYRLVQLGMIPMLLRVVFGADTGSDSPDPDDPIGHGFEL